MEETDVQRNQLDVTYQPPAPSGGGGGGGGGENATVHFRIAADVADVFPSASLGDDNDLCLTQLTYEGNTVVYMFTKESGAWALPRLLADNDSLATMIEEYSTRIQDIATDVADLQLRESYFTVRADSLDPSDAGDPANNSAPGTTVLTSRGVFWFQMGEDGWFKLLDLADAVSGGLPERDTFTLATLAGPVAAGEHYDLSGGPEGSGHRFYTVTADSPTRVRIYPTFEAQDADRGRATGVDPTVPCFLDVVVAADEVVYLAPVVMAYTKAAGDTYFATLTNLADSPSELSVDIEYVQADA